LKNIESLHIIKHDDILITNMFELSLILISENQHMSCVFYEKDKSKVIKLLNDFKNNRLSILDFKDHEDFQWFFEEECIEEFSIKDLILRNYIDEHGRRCEVLINNNFNIEKDVRIYNFKNNPIYEDFTYINTNLKYYIEDLIENEKEIIFYIYKDNLDRGFYLFDYNYGKNKYKICKKTFVFQNLTNPKETIDLKIKNINKIY